ncbi:uncharacterized protein [Nicotiana sylvestris]|uniref:uncharacterized protein n=1 Tax=Nicotiana sylvestris TaxID=4096 RepID=UPI00388C52DC
MEIGTERIRPKNVCVRDFDGIKRDTIGEIDLILTISPVDFEVTFQVLDMDTSYNFLLGRPWIHVVGVITSTLHQMVKFEHEDREIVVYGEDEQSIYRDPSVPCLEAREGSEHIVYQAFEIVVADQCKEGKPCPQPFLSNTSIMVAKEMIRYGYKPGKGLGKSLQRIAEPITSTASEKLFGVGFRPTPADVIWVDDRKNDGWVFPQLVPHLYRKFVKSKYNEEEEDKAFTAEEIEEICGAMRKILYEAHMVQLGEGSSAAEVLYMGPNAKLQNWKATPFPIRWKSCSNNAALNNMTCLRTLCPDPNTLSNYEVMNQEPEYDEEEAFREINQELEQFENKPKTNLNDMEPLTPTCEPILKLLKKDAAIKWTNECQEAFDKIKEYLSNLLKEQAIYYLSKKFTSYEAKYTLLERTCCALTWVAQKLRHYLQTYTTYLITRLDPLKYIFQRPVPTRRLAKWQILLTEFDIVYVTRTTMKAQALTDHLAENPVDNEYQPLSTYFPDEKVNSVEAVSEDTHAWKMFFDGAVNATGVEIGEIMISPTGQHYLATSRFRFFCTNNTAEYEACIMGMNMAIDQDVEELLIMGDSDLIIQQAQGEWET